MEVDIFLKRNAQERLRDIKYYNDGLYYIINEKDEYCCLILNEEITNSTSNNFNNFDL